MTVFIKDKQVSLTSVRNGDLFGQFVFPKLVLRDRGLLSKNGQGGKLAIRAYPPWDNTVNMQAQKTQKWQLEYFLAIDISIDYLMVRLLYNTNPRVTNAAPP